MTVINQTESKLTLKSVDASVNVYMSKYEHDCLHTETTQIQQRCMNMICSRGQPSFSSEGWVGHSGGGILEQWVVRLATEKAQWLACESLCVFKS